MSRWQRLILIVLILLPAFWLRLFLLDGQSLWWDEGISLHLATSTFGEIVANRITNIHPPLYFFLLKVWVILTGTSVFAARYSSVLGSFLQVALVYAVLCRWFGRGTAVIGLVLTAVWSMSIIYAQELRVYAFLPLIYLLLVWLTWESGTGQPDRQKWLALGTVEWVALHLHYNSLFLLIFLNGWLLFKLWRGPNVTSWLKVKVAVGLASLPWAIGVLLNWSAVQAEASLAGFSTQPPAWDFVLPQVWAFHLTGLVNVLDNGVVRPLSITFLALTVLLLLIQWMRGRDDNNGEPAHNARTLLLFWLGPLVLGFAVWVVRSYSHPRYIALFAAGFVLLLANLLVPSFSQPGRRADWANVLRGGTAVCFFWLSGWGVQHYFFDTAFAKDDLRSVAAMLGDMAEPTDLILLPYAGYAFQFEYHGQTPLAVPRSVQPQALWPELNDWSAHPRRLFRVMDGSDISATTGLLPFALESGGWLEQQLDFGDIRVAIYQLESPINPPDMQPQTAQFGPLRLIGAWLEQGAAADTAVTLALSWQKTEEEANQYGITLRLIDSDGLPLAQQGEPLLDELNRPTELWLPGEEFITYHRLPIVPGTPPLTYSLDLSIYKQNEGGVETIERRDQSGQLLILGETTFTQPVGVQNPYQLSETLAVLPAPQIFDNRLALLAAGIDRAEITAGQSLLVALRWQSVQGNLPDYKPRVALIQGDDTLVESAMSPALGRYPTTLWQPDEMVLEHRFLPIPAEAEGVAQLVVEIEGEQMVIADVTIAMTSRLYSLPPVDVAINRAFGESAVLIGYRLEQREVVQGEPLRLTLVWQAAPTQFSHNYTVFVHLLDQEGNLVGQHDGQPVNGGRPTTSWLPDEYLEDDHEVRLRDLTFTGTANLVVGLYDPANGERLLTENGRDFISLETEVSIIPNE